MSECYCDYETPEVYRRAEHIARKTHVCTECRQTIRPGERYTLAWGVWGGGQGSFRECSRCAALESWVKAHVPCLCVSHGNLIEDCMNASADCREDAPGLWFGALRRLHAIRKGVGA